MESLDSQEQITSYDLPRRGMEHKLFFLNSLSTRKKKPGRKKVLVVQPEEIFRTKLCLMLISCGYEPVPAEGRSAVEMYKNSHGSSEAYHSVIVDIGPAVSVKTVQKILRFDPDARVIGCCSASGQTRPELRKTAFRGILTKPYRIGQLRKALA